MDFDEVWICGWPITMKNEDPMTEIPYKTDNNCKGGPITVMLTIDEVAGAYIAWGGRERLQRTQAECCYAETDECEAGAY